LAVHVSSFSRPDHQAKAVKATEDMFKRQARCVGLQSR
jgi:hypothetical protein